MRLGEVRVARVSDWDPVVECKGSPSTFVLVVQANLVAAKIVRLPSDKQGLYQFIVVLSNSCDRSKEPAVTQAALGNIVRLNFPLEESHFLVLFFEVLCVSRFDVFAKVARTLPLDRGLPGIDALARKFETKTSLIAETWMFIHEAYIPERIVIRRKVAVFVPAVTDIERAANFAAHSPHNNCKARRDVYLCKVKHEQEWRDHYVNDRKDNPAYWPWEAAHLWFVRFKQAPFGAGTPEATDQGGINALFGSNALRHC